MEAATINGHDEDDPLFSPEDDESLTDTGNKSKSASVQSFSEIADDDDEDDDAQPEYDCPPPPKRTKTTALANDSTITIDDVSTMDASAYIAWVNQQAESLPNIFVAQSPSATTDEPPATNISISAMDPNSNHPINKDRKSANHNKDIDSFSLLSTLQVFLSHRMDILPPPTVRHLPPFSANLSQPNNNLQPSYSMHHAIFARELGDDNDAIDGTTLENGNNHPNNNHPYDWVTNILATFSKLRMHLEKMSVIQQQQQQQEYLHRTIIVPKMKDRMGWQVFCLGKDEAYGNVGGRYEYYLFDEEADDVNPGDDNANSRKEGREEQEEKITKKYNDEQHHDQPQRPPNTHPSSPAALTIGDECNDTNTDNPPQLSSYDIQPETPSSPTQPHLPTIPLLLQFDQVLTRSVFHHHVHYFCEYKLPLTRIRASWMYAILARLEKPLHREECAAVRSVLRECCERRWNLVLPSSNDNVEDEATMFNKCTEDNDNEAWVQLTLLNTLIAITGIYFEQAAFAGSGTVGKNGMDSLFSVS